MELFSKQNKQRHHPKGKRRKKSEESFRKITTKKKKEKLILYFLERQTHTPHSSLKNHGKTFFIFLIRNKH